MCEPYHSVVQYPTDDGDGDNQNRLQWGLGKIFDWGKKVGSWFHFSKLGSGHTESIEWARTRHLILPNENRYETAWWNRKVHLDGSFTGEDREYALECVKQYSHTVVIGDIKKLRNFLEISIQKTDRPYIYAEQFLTGMLTATGRDEVMKKMKRIWGTTMLSNLFFKYNKEATKLLIGYTRKRHLLVPEWADDDRLWTDSPATRSLT